MKTLSTLTAILTFPARTAGTAAIAGLRTTSRLAGWAFEQAVGSPTPASRSQWPSDPAPVTVPDAPVRTESLATAGDVDPMVGTRTPPKKTAAKKAPSKKAAVLAPALGLSEDEVLAASDADQG